MAWDFQLVTEESDLLRLGFEVPRLLIRQHKIEHADALADELDLMLAAVAKVLASDLPIEPAREEVVDHAALRKTFGAGMFLRVEFGPERGGPLAPMSAGKSKELAGDKVARMRSDEIQEMGLGFGVAEGFQSIEMGLRDAHSERISVVMPWSFRMRRRREPSSGWLYRENPALAFAANPCGR